MFGSNVKDINSVLEVTVYDEDRDHKVEFLGKVAIPLLRIRNGEKKWYSLKDKKLHGRAKGNCPQILLEMTVLWNPVSIILMSVEFPQTCAVPFSVVKMTWSSSSLDVGVMFLNIAETYSESETT